jgi:imidazolonepropionase-like amidohydrolase
VSTVIRIDNVRIFDGDRVVAVGSVEFTDRISHLGPPGGSGRPADEIVDGRGRTVLPGLIDAHTHTYGSVENLALALAFGVTTEVDMFLFPPERTRALCALAASRTDLAELRSAGAVASPPGGLPAIRIPTLPTLAGPQEAEDFVAARHAEGAHLIKIILDDGAHHGLHLPALDLATVRAVVAAARERGLPTVAHVTAVWSVELALHAGVDVLTHLPVDAPLPDSLICRAATGGQAVLPTLAILELSTAPARGRALLNDPRIADWLPAPARTAIAGGSEGLALPRPTADADMAHALRSVRLLHAAGVPVLAGTDANNAPGRACPVVHGASLHAELALLVNAGLTPTEALTAATAAPAARFGLSDRGVLAPGRRADLLLVSGDPTSTITDSRAVEAVWRQGQRFDRTAFRARHALAATESGGTV